MILIDQYLRVSLRERERGFTSSLMPPTNLPQVGPMVSGISPQEASERLNTFQVIIYLKGQ